MVLVGPPGAGKSTVGRLLAARMGVDFTDVDDLIVASAGRSIAEIFITDGEPVLGRLRKPRSRAHWPGATECSHWAAGRCSRSDRGRGFTGVAWCSCRSGWPGVRRTGLSTARPLLAGVNPRATFAALLDARLPLYREVATVEVATDGRRPDEVAEEVLDAIGAVGGTR